jgi:hypothetical protein
VGGHRTIGAADDRGTERQISLYLTLFI